LLVGVHAWVFCSYLCLLCPYMSFFPPFRHLSSHQEMSVGAWHGARQ
jgi:hypothetical protein